MLKEVGTSGQISLGKKYAGQLFDLVFYPDGRVELVPMKAVPLVQAELSTGEHHRVRENGALYRVGDGWLPPERTAKARQHPESTGEWAEKHAVEIDEYNAWASQREPYSQRVRRWRESVAPQSETGKS
jgi:hypothetical protein